MKTQFEAAVDLVYESFLRAEPHMRAGGDAVSRSPQLTRELLNAIGSPDRGQKNIVVTGSKGKGSTSRLISSILSHEGYKVGLFTSPHLVDFNERIRIDGLAISDADFIRLIREIEPHFRKIESGIPLNAYQGPVGIVLAVAMNYFAEQQTDFNVLECGRGGAYDDVNVVDHEWAVVTPIMEEHLEQLGPTIRDVAVHKLGIVTVTTPYAIIGKQSAEVLPVIQEFLHRQNVKAYLFGEQFTSSSVEVTRSGTSFAARTTDVLYPALCTPLLGQFQAENAATAIQACEVILGRPLQQEVLQTTLREIRWPGRCEIMDRDPLVIVDGAINRKTAVSLQEMIQQLGAQKIVSIIGVPKDKDYPGVIEVCSTFSELLILTKATHSHKQFPEDAHLLALQHQKNAAATETLQQALNLAYAEDGVDLILIVGTQTFIGEAKQLWKHSNLNIGM